MAQPRYFLGNRGAWMRLLVFLRLVEAVRSQNPSIAAYRSCPNNNDPIYKARFDAAVGTVVILGTATADTIPYSPEQVYIRKCRSCSGVLYEADFYCDVKFHDCGIPRNATSGGRCWEKSAGEDFFIRNIWPSVWFYYLALVLIFFTTSPGRDAQSFVYGFCRRQRNERLVDLLVQRNPRRANTLLRRFRSRQQRGQARLGVVDNSQRNDEWMFIALFRPDVTRHAENDGSGRSAGGADLNARPVSLALKTKVYHDPQAGGAPKEEKRDENDDGQPQVQVSSSAANAFEEDEGLTCTICFGPIEEGTKVGDLVCGHLFHVDCLRPWLKKRNVCPLCQKSEIAAEQYHHQRHKPEVNTAVSGREEEDEAQDEREAEDDPEDPLP